MKTCSYCGKAGQLTKEHIWPSNIIKKYEIKLASYNRKSNGFIHADPVIKDVCPQCNNVYLSKLDAYLSEMYDSFLYKCLDPGECTSINYSFELLLRSLLKISYNSARACGEDRVKIAHQKFTRFILNGGYHTGVKLRLLVVTSAKVMIDGELTHKKLPVTQLRCADISYDGVLSHRFTIRLVAINSFWFYLIISNKDEPKDKWAKFIDGFENWGLQSGIPIKPGSKKLNIPVNQTTYMSRELMGTLWDKLIAENA